jgi:outer membrane biogenesis lipoprotein LolB
MTKILFVSLTTFLLLAGCGAGVEDDTNSQRSTEKKVATGNKSGKYNLWEYIVPATSVTYNFVESVGDTTNQYSTTFTKKGNEVTEVSDYATDEKTVYTKKSDRVVVIFEKNGKQNGEYSLNLTANINQMITIKESTCKLVAHYDEKVINDKSFLDVIEINCNGKPGFYRKGTGEIAQTSSLSTNGYGNIRVLTN